MSGLASLERAITPYEDHRDYVLAVLNRRCGWLAPDDREAVFHDAYAVMLEKERDGVLDVPAMHRRQVRAYLTQTAINKALDRGKSAENTRVDPLDGALERSDGAAGPDELVEASMDGARMREIVAELPERRQAIVKLRYYLDRTPDEIQRLLGISERAYRRDLERALRHISEQYALVRDGSFCESRRSLILAFVSGVAGPNRAREAREHLASCPACTSWAVELRDAVGKAAALLPLPAVFPVGGVDRLVDLAMGVRDGIVGLVDGARQQAIMLTTRADPTAAGYASAARPGTMAAAIAGCIAIGSGATYCAVEGLPDPVRDLMVEHVAPNPHEAKPKPERKAPTEPTEPPAVAVTPTAPPVAPEPTPAPKPTPTPQPASPSPPPSPTAPADQEFGLEGFGGGDSTPSAPSAPSTPPSVAPVPGGGGATDEFGP